MSEGTWLKDGFRLRPTATAAEILKSDCHALRLRLASRQILLKKAPRQNEPVFTLLRKIR